MNTRPTNTEGLATRRAALALLDAVTIKKRLLSEVLHKKIRDLPNASKARTQRLVSECLRMIDRCDRMLGPHLSKRPSPHILNALRLGVYEICAAGEASHGVVNGYVSLMQERSRSSHYKGLVNAVLRKIDLEKDKWNALADPALPKWLRKPLIADFGKDTVKNMEKAHTKGASIDISVKNDPEKWAKALNADLLPTGSIRLPEGVQITRLGGFDAGEWWVQDAAAALPAKILSAQKGEDILDMCAAPGGKTMQMSADGANVTAVDVSPSRMKRLSENLERCQLNATTIVSDALEFSGGPYDAILLDAPCTATGTIRRHPDLPHAKDGSDFQALFELQEHMIDRALRMLKPDGRLIYCTCSLLIDEGEEQIRDALERHDDVFVDLEMLQIPGIDPSWIGAEGLRTRPDYWPELGHMDGFFISVMKRRSQ